MIVAGINEIKLCFRGICVRPGKLHGADIYILEYQGRNYGADVT